MSRTTVKTAIKTFLLTIPGVKSVFTDRPKQIPQASMPAIVIEIPNDETTERVMPALGGKAKIEHKVRLSIATISVDQDTQVSGQAFDDLLDAIDTEIRKRPTLGGPPIFAAGLDYLRTNVAESRLAGAQDGDMFRLAVKEFDVIEWVDVV
jgi:hypothetical protein